MNDSLAFEDVFLAYQHTSVLAQRKNWLRQPRTAQRDQNHGQHRAQKRTPPSRRGNRARRRNRAPRWQLKRTT